MAVVSHWTADNTAADSVGTNHGNLISGTAYAPGQINQAFSFDGIDDRVGVADSESLKLTHSMTIEGWIKATSIPATGHGFILIRGDDRGGLDPYSLSSEPNGTLNFKISSLTSAPSVSAPLPLGQFFHVAATLDDATGAMKLYENGVLMSETTTALRPFANLDPASNPSVGIGNHGGYPRTPHNFPFHGLIDDLKLYDEALSAAQVLADFNAKKGALAPSISISDTSVTEGDNSLRFVGAFVDHDNLGQPRNAIFGPDGNLFVASIDASSVLRYDGTTGEFIDTVVPSGSNGLSRPWAMTFGPDGNLYVPGSASNNVVRYNTVTGATDEYIAAGVFGLSQPKGIVFGADGDLYISSTTGGGGVAGPHEILRFAGPSAALPGAPLPAPGKLGAVFVSDGSGGLSNPNGLSFGPNGNLYVANTFGDCVNCYDSTTGASLGVLVAANAGGLDAPNYLVFRPDGMLYVASQFSNQVLRYDGTTGAFVDIAVATGSGSPNSLAFDSAGDLYVSSGSASQVLRYSRSQVAVFTVSLNAPFPSAVSVSFASGDGTALQGSDYGATSGTLTFTPGQMSKTVLVNTTDDALLEASETFTMHLANAVGATIADGQGVGTIQDNDLPPTKFYIVNDGSPDRTYEYGSNGTAVENYAINSGNTAPRGAASNVVGDKVWVVDANRNVYVYNTSGAVLGTWTVGGFNSSAQFEGIAVSGSDVWIVDAKSDKVYRYAGAAGRLSGSQNAASSFALNSTNTSPKDLVTDGVYLWVVNDSTTDKVFKYTLAGSLVGSWTISTVSGGGSPTGITIDPANVSDIWIVDNASDRVYQYTAAAGRTSGSQSAATSFALSAGNTNPQGIADPPAGAFLQGSTTTLSEPMRSHRRIDSTLVAAVEQLFGELDSGWTRRSRMKVRA